MSKYLEFKEARCKNCYKCLKLCPVKAIKIEEDQAKIVEDRCILCGKCTLICPQNAKKVHSEIDNVKELIKNNKVIASIAPSFISSFNLKNFDAMDNALKKLGFAYAEETARGAKIVINEYEKLLNSKQYKNFITSCCPAVNKMISIYYPEALKYLAPVDSPMLAHAKLLKKENPDCKVVFIGPCIAKKREAEESGVVDGVLTFEDMLKLFEEYEIKFSEDEMQAEISTWNENEMTQNSMEATFNKARFFPISRGVIKSFDTLLDDYEYIAVDGPERCREVLSEIDSLSNVFLEMNMCESSCINGPCSLVKGRAAVTSNAKVRKYVRCNNSVSIVAEENNCDIDFSHIHSASNVEVKEPTEDEIREILTRTGKFNEEDELNCGACGYSTCREKAWAVYNGLAELEMCLPYMRERAENMSSEIIKNSPNGIIIVDTEFKIIDINGKAKSLLGIQEFKNGEYSILDFIDDNTGFIIAKEQKQDIPFRKVKIEKTNSFVELSINYLPENDVMFSIMKDVTERALYDEKLNEFKAETLATTDEVIKKHMRVAQEIASLLGETTAETKVALVKLKKAFEESEKQGD